MNIKDRVAQLLQSSFAGATVNVEDGPYGRVDALVVSGSFQVVSDQARQGLVWRALKQQLSKEEQLQVSFVLASTPEEEASLKEHPADGD
jgi:acid stress-induced BolA-like protein IbaG/YrbA